MIIVECYLDEYVIKSLGFSTHTIRHQPGKGRVLKSLRKKFGKVGIVDEDPESSQPRDLENYVVVKRSKDITFFERKEDSEVKLIQISNYLEHWIIKRSAVNNLDINAYGFPNNPIKLHEIPHIERIQNFQNFLQDLIQADNEFALLRDWISSII